MKKILFTLEVMLMPGALPLFCGMALGRKHHVNPGVQTSVSKLVSQETGNALVVYPDALENS